MNQICLEKDFVIRAVTNIIDQTCPSYKDKPKSPWVSAKEAKELLQISSDTTLQNFRNQGKLTYAKVTPKTIIYSLESINQYIKSKTHDRF
ncbi:helix-turn-helix domain-containing protein [Fulvivirga lutea]|uniref:Helix-turn-helix domain-containing protein n=1 Tax=Fulvivirga lutea TaxID=2810512 RepID=A0A975A288_9BACT|nr:helix-turn-helix domain-containing protein [Fulvivirga lutea]QSE99186.1 helix-turn-helix domain-containing protein [Fulvivirga lutea]